MVKAVGALGVNISVGESRELIFLIGECFTSSKIKFCCLCYSMLCPYPTLLLILSSHPFILSFPFSHPSSLHPTPLPPPFSTWETGQNSERRSICFHITYVPFLRRTAHPSRKRPAERRYSSLQKTKVHCTCIDLGVCSVFSLSCLQSFIVYS